MTAKYYPLSYKFPKEIIAGLNNRDAQWHGLYHINITNGERTLLLQNDRFTQFTVDNDYRLREGILKTFF